MSEVVLPPWIIPEQESHEWLDEGSSVFRSAFAPGLAQRQSYGGLRLKLSRRHTVRAEEKAQLLAALYATRGQYNVLRTRVHFVLRGSFPASELITNNSFESGISGWGIDAGSEVALSVADRVMRATRAEGGTSRIIGRTSAQSVTQYAPHIARAMIVEGRGPISVDVRLGSIAGQNDFGNTSQTSSAGLLSLASVPYETSAHIGITDFAGASVGKIAGDFFDIPYVTLSRCALIDNAPNLLVRSDELDNASWTKSNSSVTANAGTAPDETSTADAIVEDSSNTTHFILQAVSVSSTVGDYAFSVALKANSRTWAAMQVLEDAGNTTVTAYFNLSTGAVGTTATGANWDDLRTFVTSMGGGWYRCTLVARKTSAATTLSCRIFIASADNTATYTGDGSSNILAWRATIANSSVPTRLRQTTSAGDSSGDGQRGGGFHLKGLPASENGLLLPGDWFEVNGELKQCASALNSDASGLGFLRYEPETVNIPANETPLIILNPIGKFLVSNIKIDNEFGTQARVSYDLEHIYE